jgi:integrase
MNKPIKQGNKWRIRWTDETGQRQSEVFTDIKDAEFALKKHTLLVEEIKRGFSVRAPKPKRFKEILEWWLEFKTPKKRRPADDISIIKNHLRPSFEKHFIHQINTDSVARFTSKLNHLEPQTINNILTLLISMLRAAKELGWLPTLPTIKKPKVRLFCQEYRWLRTDEEIDSFLESARAEEDTNVFAMYATAIYTGMRAGELAGLKWADIDLAKRLITVQRSFTGPTKAGDLRHVPILDTLLPVLREWS